MSRKEGVKALTSISACLNAVVNIRLIFSLHTAQYQASQIAVKIFLQLSYLCSMSRLGTADHDSPLSGRLASHCTTRRFGPKALHSGRDTA